MKKKRPSYKEVWRESGIREREKQILRQEQKLVKFETKMLKQALPSDEFVIAEADTLKTKQLAARGWEIIAPPVSFFSGTHKLRIARSVLEARING